MVELSRPFAIICSVLFFLLLIFLIIIFITIFIGDAIFSFGRLLGIPLLFVCGYLTRKFYDKILKEEP